jgi:Ser/Thr protein kinase RdoA (MazF antagonist)
LNETAIIAAVAAQFRIDGRLVAAQRYGNGHINQTYLGRYETGAGEMRFIHQRINDRVFADVEGLMENIGRVTRHAPGVTPALVQTIDGRDVLRTDDGEWWRTYAFVAGARSYETVESPDQAYRVALAFGKFVQHLSDLGGARLNDTIPRFHDTPMRFETFLEALRRDPLRRASEVKDEIAYCLRNEALADRLAALRRDGTAREYATHNDTKLNNVLIDEQTGDGVCVIDLDSVMPGIVLYDFGDLVRTATARAAEDERDLGLVDVDVDLFAAVARGFVEGAGSMLTVAERDHLVTAGRVITFECGIRFLTDYLLGDTYFRTHRPRQNLDRARVQFALVDSLERREDELR